MCSARSCLFKTCSRLLAILAAVLATAPPAARGVEIPGATILVGKNNLIGSFGGTMATYTYDAASDVYYVGVFGSTQGLQKVWRESPGDP
ncbi:MAG: hypothetical protein U1E05_19785, partial [Patescibacteria group bacterium]|nr:hypothetical protein [Patescibacteria group bacterium]